MPTKKPFKYVHPDFVYIGRKACGCVAAVANDDGDKDTRETVSDFIESKLNISRVSWLDYRSTVSLEPTFLSCPHGDPPLEALQQLPLFVEEK